MIEKFLLLLIINSITTQYSEVRKSSEIQFILKPFYQSKVREFFKVWHALYMKNYDLESQIGEDKFKIFKENIKEIDSIKDFEAGFTEFADLTESEFQNTYLSKNINENDKIEKKFNKIQKYLIEHEDFDLTKRRMEELERIDYSKFMNPPRHQFECGSSWSFAIISAIEGNLRLNDENHSLSTQNLIDCVEIHNKGCEGGSSKSAMKYVMEKGLHLESNYKYTASKENCNEKSDSKRVKLVGYELCDNNSNGECTKLKILKMLRKGPLVVSVNGNNFKYYLNGILKNDCGNLNYAASLVGFSFDKIEKKYYWLMKASLGESWGINGYVKFEGNSCWKGHDVILPLTK